MPTKFEPDYKGKKEKPEPAPEKEQKEKKDAKEEGVDFASLLERGAGWKYTLGAGAIGAAVFFLFYILKLILDVLLSKSFAPITALVYPIAIFIPILIGIGIGFGLKRVEPDAKMADGAIAGVVAGLLGSSLGAVLILLELFLLHINAPYFVLSGGVLSAVMVVAVSSIQIFLCAIPAALVAHFVKGGG